MYTYGRFMLRFDQKQNNSVKQLSMKKKKSTLDIHWKDWCWILSSNSLASWMEDSTDAGKDWRQKKKGTTEDEMVKQHQWHNGHKFEQTSGDSEGLRSLACHSPWGSQGVGNDLATEQQHAQFVFLINVLIF